MTEEEKELYTVIAQQKSVESIVSAALEELAELSVELAKFLNIKESVGKIEEEVADVEIMMAQLRCLFMDNAIDKWKKSKLNKLKEQYGN